MSKDNGDELLVIFLTMILGLLQGQDFYTSTFYFFDIINIIIYLIGYLSNSFAFCFDISI